jgi:hypothetical protein
MLSICAVPVNLYVFFFCLFSVIFLAFVLYLIVNLVLFLYLSQETTGMRLRRTQRVRMMVCRCLALTLSWRAWPASAPPCPPSRRPAVSSARLAKVREALCNLVVLKSRKDWGSCGTLPCGTCRFFPLLLIYTTGLANPQHHTKDSCPFS